jgi:GH15 family glucan-1,4-alpha-glucosidase
VDGLVRRYRDEQAVDGLPSGEGGFLACSFWLVDALVREGRAAEATELFERLLSLRNDVGLLAEEYNPDTGRLVGNFRRPSRTSRSSTARSTSRADLPPPMRADPRGAA